MFFLLCSALSQVIYWNGTQLPDALGQARVCRTPSRERGASFSPFLRFEGTLIIEQGAVVNSGRTFEFTSSSDTYIDRGYFSASARVFLLNS